MTENQINELRLMILPTSPWFGYSADGITKMKDEDQYILLEFKCPKNDKKLIAANLIKTLPYINVSENQCTLKKHHAYYGQIQLGLCLYNLTICHFVIYDYVNDTCAVIVVLLN